MFSLSKSVILDYFDWIGLWYTHNKWNVFFRFDVVGINSEGLFSLIGCIEKLEHLSPYQLIITIHYCQNLTRTTIIIDCLVDISHMILSLFIFHKCHSLFHIMVLLNLSLNFVCSAVLWVIIHNDYMIFLIILLHNCVEIHKISKFVSIFVRGHNHTKLKLGIRTNVVLCLIHRFFWG